MKALDQIGKQTIKPPISPLQDREFNYQLALFGFALLVFLTWIVLHPYRGIVHDSTLYTLGALARLHPELLSNDIFLRFGSQDQYTLFSPIFASAIELLGLEPAAAALTLAGQLAFFSCAWLLARRFMPTHMALLSVGLLVAMPSAYGAQSIFRFIEEFLTPRQFAETLVIAGLAASLAQRQWLAALCMVAATLLHPIMAAAGAALLFCFHAAFLRPKTSLAIFTMGLSFVAAMALWSPYGVFASFDTEWLKPLLERSYFLFLSSWSFEDWVRVLIPLSILILGALIGTEQALQKLCAAGLLTASAGLLSTALACDLLQIVTATQLQPWRWLWITNVVAILLLPVIARDCWRAGAAAQASLLLIATAWVFRGQSFNEIALAIVLLAVALSLMNNRMRHGGHSRLFFYGACVLFALSIVPSIVEIATLWMPSKPDDHQGSFLLEQLRKSSHDGIVPAAFLTLSWLAMWRFGWKAGFVAVAFGIWSGTALLPHARGLLTQGKEMQFTEDLYSKFADWRQIIPPGTEVLWPEMPVASWYWLERPSYISIHQSAGMVFSRAAAVELDRRTQMAAPLLPRSEFQGLVPEHAWAMTGHEKLFNVCRNSSIGHVVTLDNLGEVPIKTISLYSKHPNIQYKLYSCRKPL